MASTTALFTGLSGLNANSRLIDVIGNNISNVNTTAYKSNRLQFSSMFDRTFSIGSAPGANNGGTNPGQIGLGVGGMGRGSRGRAMGAQVAGKGGKVKVECALAVLRRVDPQLGMKRPQRYRPVHACGGRGQILTVMQRKIGSGKGGCGGALHLGAAERGFVQRG